MNLEYAKAAIIHQSEQVSFTAQMQQQRYAELPSIYKDFKEGRIGAKELYSGKPRMVQSVESAR